MNRCQKGSTPMTSRDEYGDIPGQGDSQYATMDTVLPDANLHVRGTIPRKGGRTEFWLTSPRPRGMSMEEWDEITTDRFDRAFGKGKYAKAEKSI